MVTDEVIEFFWDEFERRAATEIERGVDGIYLVLHGACASESFPDVEGVLLRRIRALADAEELPICGVLDLHANVTGAMAELSDGLVAYRENPHTDAKAAAAKGAELLQEIFDRGRRPRTLWSHPPVMWPPTGVATADDPMRRLETLARSIEQDDQEIAAVNVLAGFAFADTPETGVSFTAVTFGSVETARAALECLSESTLLHRDEGIVLDAAFESLLPRLAQCEGKLAVLAEPSDNIGGGTSGDGTGLLRCFVEHNVQNAAVVINDPEAVATLASHEYGDTIELAIGGKGSALDAGPLTLPVEYISSSDGRFALEDPHSHLASIGSSQIEMGPCGVVRHRGVRILLTSNKTPPFDLGQLRSQGIVPEELSVLAVKAAVAHRRAFVNIPCEFYSVDTPGPCSSNLKALPFEKLRRPIFPLDD